MLEKRSIPKINIIIYIYIYIYIGDYVEDNLCGELYDVMMYNV